MLLNPMIYTKFQFYSNHIFESLFIITYPDLDKRQYRVLNIIPIIVIILFKYVV